MVEARAWWKDLLIGAGLATAVTAVVTGCAAQKSKTPAPEPPPIQTPYTVPTVPPRTPTPEGGAAPLPTRPLEDPEAQKAKKAGKPIGPVITHLGTARADGRVVTSSEKANGVPVYVNYVGSGFLIVVEAKPGLSNLEVGRRIFAHDANDPKKRPDLEIQVSRALGDGSAEVCDARRPDIGGVPGIDPPSFAETKQVAAALNDLSCRFETFIESAGSCTLNAQGDFSFVAKDTVTQFCMVVAKAWNFPVGDTLVSARLRDSKGEPGPVSQFVLRRPAARPTAKPAPKTTPKPTPARRRP